MNPTNHLSENYNLREYYLKTDQAPTQSMMKAKMTAPLADVYFKMMSPKLKVLAGLEPPMKGGGGDWYMPPKDILEGRAVLKPLKKEYLSELNYLGIDKICMKTVEKRRRCMREERKKMIADNDEKWKAHVMAEYAQYFANLSKEAASKNTQILLEASKDFSILYERSFTTLESLMYDAACSEIKRVQDAAARTMSEKYETSLATQARRICDKFRNKLETEKTRLKNEFIEEVEKCRTELGTQIHDVVLEKHVAIEKSRQYLQCVGLACQVYVALKEKEECERQMKYAKHLHRKKVKTLADEIAYRDYEIGIQMEKAKVQSEFEESWKKKVSCTVNRFQVLVSYCISLLPADADFFINLEKIMLLHLDEVLENPNAESIFEGERAEESHEDPRPNPHPYYLCCDKRFTTTEVPIHKELCPQHCTSSASHMPVVVIDKRLIYAACDNFQQFTNKVKHFMHGHRGDDIDFLDQQDYTQCVPVTYTKSQQILELKLESSFMQILQQEYENVREVPATCEFCKTPHCFCTKDRVEKIKLSETPVTPKPSVSEAKSYTKLEMKPNYQADQYYETYVKPKRCQCGKLAKRHLQELLPTYMRSKRIGEAFLPNYEPCPVHMIKKMVRDARGRKHLPVDRKDSKTRDVASQYEDEQYILVCECLSADAFQRLRDNEKITGSILFHPSITASQFQFIEHCSSSASSNRNVSPVEAKVQSRKVLLGDYSPSIEEIFRAAARK